MTDEDSQNNPAVRDHRKRFFISYFLYKIREL
jgi:hypothetical protein